ncbi:MAG TPA: ATP-binding protein [Bacteroidia bacterium]|jgi:PAS domain S-box-containing protein|nr:ATP-binding protein [Bacteroidia bacterium]
MKLRIKTKLSLGLTFFFIMIVLIGAVGLFAINRLADESKNILKANYESIEYSENMQQAIDAYETKEPEALNKFEKNLKAQENNITEVGEQDATASVREMFERLKTADSVTAEKIEKELRTGLYKISDLNTNAIVRKNNETQQTADKLKIYLAILATVAFLISFTMLMNFPGYIADPISKLTEGIKQIANRNYSQRIHIEKGDEFGELAEAFNTMAQKLDDYNNSNLAKIIFQKKRIDTIINNMKDPIIGLDENRKILFVNSSSIKILGINASELIGKYAPDVALKNDLLRALISTKEGATPLKIYADNRESYFTKEVLKITADEQPIGEVIILKNITQFKELDLAKTNFIATVSHSLKTPISSIKMSLKLLGDQRIGNTNEEQKQLINHIQEDSERLLNITSELLNMTQVETGNIQLNFRQTNPKEIVDYAVDTIRMQAEQKHVALEIICPERTKKVLIDPEKTVWVMVNLLSNALRYSPENEKMIIQVTQNDSDIEFSVKDFGIGIPDKYKDRLFQRYFQVPGSSRSGTGLGLAISKEFIEAQNGKIGVESKVGEGSRFYFTLPTV